MQHDEMIWQVINNQFCSFKTTIGSAKSDRRDFCRHPYSVTGLCNRSSCPLANSRYATVREENGRVSLYLKTVERAHSPKNLWERISLSRNYAKALAQLDEHLAFWPKNLIHRNKQRLTKVHQYLIRMRKIKLRQLAGQKAKMVGVNRKIDQREERREKKALAAAKIENNIEKELLERLANGTYGDIYNFPEVPYQKALEEAGAVQEEEEEEEGPNEYDTEPYYYDEEAGPSKAAPESPFPEGSWQDEAYKTAYDWLNGTDEEESMEQVAKDQRVRIAVGVLLGFGVVLALMTASCALNNPDGLCAGCCRLLLRCISCFFRVLCLPCRYACCGAGRDEDRHGATLVGRSDLEFS
mmetsp:Transcript_1353/g.2445  ORF Transcript_1353/g.2445 Transcript_1353/m.2445 type:complete len:354 (-) Transcript_1353:4339-5400(-)